MEDLYPAVFVTVIPPGQAKVATFSFCRNFGTPPQIRTARTSPFERDDFTNLSMGACVVDVSGIEPLTHSVSSCCTTAVLNIQLVPQRRLELLRLATLVPKTSVSTIPPPGH